MKEPLNHFFYDTSCYQEYIEAINLETFFFFKFINLGGKLKVDLQSRPRLSSPSLGLAEMESRPGLKGDEAKSRSSSKESETKSSLAKNHQILFWGRAFTSTSWLHSYDALMIRLFFVRSEYSCNTNFIWNWVFF